MLFMWTNMKNGFFFLSLIVLITTQSMSLVLAQDDSDESGFKQQAFTLYQKALQAYQNEDFHGCAELCKQAINFDNQNKQLFHLEALSLAQTGDNEQALM